ncbi:uncharacterized protein BDV14DRAFT_186920 [Aspergillus stella-maris]|uniref:uncharacterized protein n=1 Tax=Aspergillus stella-maris TaxID=1810926 RepID=UPI003CCD1B3C
MNALTRPSLGQTAQISTLYDATTDTILPESLIAHNTEVPPSAITSTPLDKCKTTIIKTGTTSETIKSFGIERDLGASILAETVTPKPTGSGKYLSRQRDDEPTVHRAVVQTITTGEQQLNFMGGDLRNLLDPGVLQRSQATHVLTGVTFGARAIVSASRDVSISEDRADCELIPDDTLKVLYEGDQEEEAGDEGSGSGCNWLELPLDNDNEACEPDAEEALTGQSDNLADALSHLRQLGPYVRKTGGNHCRRDKIEMHKAMATQARLRAEFKTALQSVRNNTATSQIIDLQNLTDSCDMNLGFLSRMEDLGAVYVGDQDHSPQQVIDRAARIHSTFHVFHFNGKSMDTSDSTWKQNQRLLEEILAQRPKPRVVLIDWATEQPDLKEPYITVYNNGILVVDNLLEQKRETAGKHLVRYDRTFLEPNTDVPTYRKTLRIPCLGPYCDEQEIHLWSCSDCQDAIEFGSRDGYFYCECGRVPFDRTEFNCQGPRHKDVDLEDLLRSLPAPREVNISILGETGVSKSTFVNAFVNYLTFSSLVEGLKYPKLNCIIPCSFTTQVVDDTGRMISEDIVVGKDSDEADGSKGDSATQKATVYPLYFKDTLVRLIDTLGIGGTRVMFRFCIKELLTHLHTRAAQNMVFGFTNTRGSNYTPGDTFKPLEALLSEYRKVIPPLSRSNVYCFDSESFRYLAEADRLLIHFRSLRPHHTQGTLSLNETRHIIAQLTAPMQQISVVITDTIAKNEKEMVELNNVQGTMDDLKGKLNIHKTTIVATQLTQPKTVCANPACVETVRDKKTDSKIKLRKKLCHNPCCLRNVPVGIIETPELCALCKHSWKEHEHILVEYAKQQEAAIDATVQREITTTGSMIKTKKAVIKAIEKNIAELKDEHAANSIMHYNDATVEYLEHLIKDEKMKVRTGQSRLRLEALERGLDKYKKFVDTMEKGGKAEGSQKTCAPLNEEGVAKLDQSLYNLPHYGQMLKDLAQVVASAYEANFRERPYRISRTRQWRHQSAAQGSSSAMYGRRQNQIPRRSFLTQTTTRQAPSPTAEEFGTSSASAERRMLIPGKGEESSDFWPSEKQPSSSGPVRSIMDWGDAANRVGSSAAGGGMMASGLSPAPPPYSGPGVPESRDGNSGSGTAPKRGFFGRLKGKLRKKE